MIIVLDFGSQYSHLICRRVRELGVNARILPYNSTAKDIKRCSPNGIILSGSPSSTMDKVHPQPDAAVLEMGIPVLGICYGMQLMAVMLGGRVSRIGSREYGEARLKVITRGKLFFRMPESLKIWMSHYDTVTEIPQSFSVMGKTSSIPIAAMGDPHRNYYGIQFHPEVAHTPEGMKLLSNFVFRICSSEKDWNLGKWIEQQTVSMKREVGSGRVIMALSGGVDSSIASVLIRNAVGKRFTPIFVEHGLTRYKDRKKIEDILIARMGIDVKIVDAEKRFFDALKGVRDPEKKRKLIGNEFVKVFVKEAKKVSNATHLAQGTLYPDVIESAGSGVNSSVIKTHHNVGGLPDDLDLKLLEPFKYLYKDEVRIIGRKLGVPSQLIDQHPFPGPGLGIRIIGAVNRARRDILRKADVIVEEELKTAGIYYDLWQAFPVFLPVRSVGVMGDSRTYENVIALRLVESIDAMTASWGYVPHNVLSSISTRIVNEIPGINRVVYDITNKPPGTIEWE